MVKGNKKAKAANQTPMDNHGIWREVNKYGPCKPLPSLLLAIAKWAIYAMEPSKAGSASGVDVAAAPGGPGPHKPGHPTYRAT
eukprot:10932222-Heterocapsa_arctica.AAC.1